ncbi:hypothetical protein VCRA2122O12_270026 [Vibrio crassostreae]|nr:hypothetical protein VCRA2110O1_270053 [Vibrio crassostreae]CAK1942288.1 hypothetical protein VCRA2110O4_270053 [Vibrio crassostreae]CAK1947693.1 hypothetical protein VCRA2114E5_260053 [Vibrio crassostreae]CAK2408312.1 hypothetical protein VCRA2116O29_140062 [Vibrio crassostreae]CAK2415488.1 hypothetical protein VCRA2119O48_160045 [Vibrio crassostreae]
MFILLKGGSLLNNWFNVNTQMIRDNPESMDVNWAFLKAKSTLSPSKALVTSVKKSA